MPKPAAGAGEGVSRRYDAVIIGSGSGGREVASRLAGAGRSVAIVERELFGGECPFWACMPAKAQLRPLSAAAQAGRVPGVRAEITGQDAVLEFRERVRAHGDDSEKLDEYDGRGIDVVRGVGRLAGPGRVAVGHEVLEARDVVIATGSSAVVPPVDGLAECGYWTHRDVATLGAVPTSAVVLGGGPVGLESAQQLSRLGARVTVIESADRLLDSEEPELGETLAEQLSAEGISIRLGAEATAVRASDSGLELVLDGESLRVERVLVATGRRPAVDGIGLETVGVEPEDGAVPIDESCRVRDGVWAVGDVTGKGLFTHLASYQGRIAAAAILGEPARADYRAVPRSVFTDPETAAVGLTGDAADERGVATVTASVALEEMERSSTYGSEPAGLAGLRARRDDGVIVGGYAVGPHASEWIHVAVMAVKLCATADAVGDTIGQFPTFAESFLTAARRLELSRR